MPPKSAKKTSKSRGKSSKPAKARKPLPGHRLKVLLAAFFLAAFLLLSLVLLAHLRQSLRTVPPKPPVARPAVKPRPEPEVRPSTLVEDLRVELESTLLRSGISLDELTITVEGETRRCEIRGAFPAKEVVAELEPRLARLDADLRLDARPQTGELLVYRGKSLLYRLLFRRPATPPVGPPVMSGARLAIIMDDLGRDLATARALLAIDLPVTFAVLPVEAHAAQVAELAHQGGRQVLIHIPMEPQGYPVTDPGEDALFVGQSAEEIRARLAGYRERVPHAVGGNNHMGSRFTEDREGMAVVLEEMRIAGLFFVDSLTTGRSVAFAEARRAGVPAAVRDIFLDNDQDVALISRQIRKLAVLAGRQGQAVGICHPYPETLEALRREAGFLKQQGIEVVPVSQLLVR